MKNHFIKLATLVLLTVSSFACKREYDDKTLNPLGDLVADIPVTVTNYDYFERYPIVNASISGGGAFHFDMQIPADRGTIKEITKVTTGPVAASSSLVNLNSITSMTGAGAALAYNATGTGANRVVNPIPGNATNTITFSSNLNTYLAFRRANGATVGPATTTTTPVGLPAPTTNASQTPTEIQFYFLITLTDGTTIIPQPARVRVQP
jgi:hypothetical protein